MMSPKNKFKFVPVLVGILTLVYAVSPSHAELADRNRPVHLEAEQVSIDDAKQISTFTGNVVLTQGTLEIRGDMLVVKQNSEGLQHGTATGKPASFRQKRDGVDEYIEGYGERIVYNSAKTTLDLFCNARMKRGQDEVSSEHITYNSTTEIFQANGLTANTPGAPRKGRVRVVIQPKNEAVPSTPAVNPLPAPAQTLTPPENKP